MALYYDGADNEFHPQKHLLDFGLLTVVCEAYPGLDKKAVRLILPQSSAVPLLLQLLSGAANNLPALG